MPRGNGTGPMGFGPGTGRGKGGCVPGTGKPGMKRVLWGAVIPFAGAVIKDIINPHGILRSLIGKLSCRQMLSGPTNKVDTTYTTLEDKDFTKKKPDQNSR